MLLRRLRDDLPFTPVNGVRPLPSVNSPVVPLPPVDESFYQVRPLPPVINPDAVRPIPPVDGGIRLASGVMSDHSAQGGETPPPITLPHAMDEYAEQSRNDGVAPRLLENPVKPTTPLVLEGGVADYNNERTYLAPTAQKGMRGVAQRMGQAVAAPVSRVQSLAKMLYDNTTNPYYDEKTRQYRGLPPPNLPVNDIEKMASRDYVESYYPRRRM